jgi:hypothetical protein
MEEMMCSWTLDELLLLTRQELCEIAETIEALLPALEAGTSMRVSALTSLANVRRAILLRGFHF